MSIFEKVAAAAGDPIFTLTEKFKADERADKINLTVGVYQNERGETVVFDSVKEAAKRYSASWDVAGYLPMHGFVEFTEAVKKLNYGETSKALSENRIASIQTPGGTGALRVAAQFLSLVFGKKTIALSDPTWSNHKKIFTDAGHELKNYRYFNKETMSLDSDGFIEDLGSLEAGSVVVLHAACHNPTGCDIDESLYPAVAKAIREKELIPILDFAYQGFGAGLEEDASLVRYLEAEGLNFLLATSLSKNFGLYRQRTASLSAVCASEEETTRIFSQLKSSARGIYSNPPAFGATVAATILGDDELCSMWKNELNTTRKRIDSMRTAFAEVLEACGMDSSHVKAQRGMFSFSGISSEQVDRLREECGIYIVSSGRVCLAALNDKNLPYFKESLAKVA